MKIVKISETEKVNNPHGVDARKLHDNDNVQVVHLELKPGDKIIKHAAHIDVFFFVLAGSGIVEIGEEQAEVFEGTLIDSPANIAHGWHNNSDKPLRILVTKTPKPTTEQNHQAIQSIKNNLH
jgi:quercetin dioxygenase-like cupin family protein